MCPYPTAEFFLSSGDSRLLSPGHSYTVAVELEMPESPQNADLGKRGREREGVVIYYILKVCSWLI